MIYKPIVYLINIINMPVTVSSDSTLDEGEFSHDSLRFVLFSLLLNPDLDVSRYHRRDFSTLHAITKRGRG